MSDQTAETVDIARGRYRPERLTMLVDGVFAISMTLLALEVRIAAPETGADPVAAFAENEHELLRRLVVFVVAFLITTRFWLVNHRHMAGVQVVDHGLLERTLLFLAGITTIPVATGVLFEYGSVPGAVTFAAVVLAVTSLLSARAWWYLSDPEHALAGVEPRVRRETMLRSLLVVVAYLLAVPLAFAVPPDAVSSVPLVWLLLAGVDPASSFLYRRFGRRGEA